MFEIPTRVGAPWEDWEDARILTDLRLGVEPWLIAQRARRSEQEVLERLRQLQRPAARGKKR